MSLMAPVQRVTGFDTVMPLYRLEDRYLPDRTRVLDAAHQALAFA